MVVFVEVPVVKGHSQETVLSSWGIMCILGTQKVNLIEVSDRKEEQSLPNFFFFGVWLLCV